MHQPIRCLPSLVHHLSAPYVSDPFSVVSRYSGNDWKELKLHHPLSLFRNEYMELLLSNWAPGRFDIYHNNYSTVHTRVIEGELSISYMNGKSLYNKPPSKIITIYGGHSHTFHPFSKVRLHAWKPSSMLQLYYYQNMY